ncbi:hypothetical protein T08_16743 [Trichinella sp. T8]|nr:hypothetical protein T08_16743 [Trichinella sp. T8]
MRKRRSENGFDTKQNKRSQGSWYPNSVGLVLEYFERANERGRHKVKQQNTGGACGYPSVPILLVSAGENSNG